MLGMIFVGILYFYDLIRPIDKKFNINKSVSTLDSGFHSIIKQIAEQTDQVVVRNIRGGETWLHEDTKIKLFLQG